MSTSIPLSRREAAAPCGRWSLTASTTPSCRVSRSAAEPVGDGEPRRVVGEHEVVVAELDRGERHLLDRRAAVGPVGVGVQVAAQRARSSRAARGRAGRRARVSSLASRSGTHAAHGVGDHLGGAGADAGQLGEACRPRPRRGHLVGRQRQDRRRGAAEGLDLVGVLAAPLEQERDPAQRRDRPAVVRLRCPTPRTSSSTFFPPHPVDSHSGWSARRPARAPGRVIHSPIPSEAGSSTAIARRPQVCPQVCPQGWATLR